MQPVLIPGATLLLDRHYNSTVPYSPGRAQSLCRRSRQFARLPLRHFAGPQPHPQRPQSRVRAVLASVAGRPVRRRCHRRPRLSHRLPPLSRSALPPGHVKLVASHRRMFMEQAQNSPGGNRRSEDIALDLLKFVASVAGVGRTTTTSTGFTAPSAPSRKTSSPNCSSSTPAACMRSRARHKTGLSSQKKLRVAVFGAALLAATICASTANSKMPATRSPWPRSSIPIPNSPPAPPANGAFPPIPRSTNSSAKPTPLTLHRSASRPPPFRSCFHLARKRNRPAHREAHSGIHSRGRPTRPFSANPRPNSPGRPSRTFQPRRRRHPALFERPDVLRGP